MLNLEQPHTVSVATNYLVCQINFLFFCSTVRLNMLRLKVAFWYFCKCDISNRNIPPLKGKTQTYLAVDSCVSLLASLPLCRSLCLIPWPSTLPQRLSALLLPCPLQWFRAPLPPVPCPHTPFPQERLAGGASSSEPELSFWFSVPHPK